MQRSKGETDIGEVCIIKTYLFAQGKMKQLTVARSPYIWNYSPIFQQINWMNALMNVLNQDN